MDKIIRIKDFQKTETTENEKLADEKPVVNNEKITNPIKKTGIKQLENLAKFTNQDISKKFDINDLLR